MSEYLGGVLKVPKSFFELLLVVGSYYGLSSSDVSRVLVNRDARRSFGEVIPEAASIPEVLFWVVKTANWGEVPLQLEDELREKPFLRNFSMALDGQGKLAIKEGSETTQGVTEQRA